MLSYLIYSSSACKPYSLKDLEYLGSEAAAINLKEDVTGLLLYDSMQFLQVLEGDPQIIQATFDRIKNDSRHKGVKLLIFDSIPQRNFPHWAMKASNIYNDSMIKPFFIPDNPSSPTSYISLIYHLLSISFSRELKEIKSNKLTHHDSEKSIIFGCMTKREKHVLALLVKGYKLNNLADALHISPKTVARHIENIKYKLHCKTKSDLILKVFSSGYILELLDY